MTRERLPDTREAVTFKTLIRGEPKVFICPKCGEQTQRENGNRKVYLTVGFYEDGRIGEIFLKMDKQGQTSRGALDCFAIAVSLLLQHGANPEEIIEKFRFQRFEPEGMTSDKDEDGKTLSVMSPIDWAMRKLEGIQKK